MTPSPDPPVPSTSTPVSRRTVLRSAGALAVGGVGVATGYALRGLVEPVAEPVAVGPSSSPVLVAAASGGPSPSAATTASRPPALRHAFRSRPDLQPPMLVVGVAASHRAAGLVFTTPNNGEAPDGPTIYDDAGDPVWIHPVEGRQATDLHVVDWNGGAALAWWEGKATTGVGDGEFVVVDPSYRELARIAAGAHADLHELQLTPGGTALLVVYERVPMPPSAGTDASSTATAAPAEMYDCVVVELDPATGRRIWEWHAAEHIRADESEAGYPTDAGVPWDPVHVNSVELDADGNLLVSARNTSCVYKVSRASGDIMWRLGGRRGDIALLDGLSITLQHDVRRRADGTISIFDNGRPPTPARGIVVALDEDAKTARPVRTLQRPDPVQAQSQGSFQLLPNGNVLIGWGAQAIATEFDSDGGVVWDATMPAGIQSYRDRRYPWTGQPDVPPDLAVEPVAKGSGTQRRVTAYASWNGATEVRAWRLVAGGPEGSLDVLATVPRSGFETVLTGLTTIDPVVRVQAAALDASGSVLMETAVVAPPTGEGG